MEFVLAIGEVVIGRFACHIRQLGGAILDVDLTRRGTFLKIKERLRLFLISLRDLDGIPIFLLRDDVDSFEDILSIAEGGIAVDIGPIQQIEFKEKRNILIV